MNPSNILDLAIKIWKKGTYEGGYAVKYNGETRIMKTYVTNKEWEEFLNQMDESAVTDFENGDGDELSEKNGRPPKMACYGSSSRMLYELSRGTCGFRYEKKLPTTVGGTANLDGFLESSDKYIFVESKCHEPYSAPKKITVSERYGKLYEYLAEHTANEFSVKLAHSSKPHKIDAEFFAKGEKIEYFDIKQMICHMLGIATGILKGNLSPKQTDFIYLLFNPVILGYDSYEEREAVEKIYRKTCYERDLLDFSELMRWILYYLKTEKYPESLTEDDIDLYIRKFNFIPATQDEYPSLINI